MVVGGNQMQFWVLVLLKIQLLVGWWSKELLIGVAVSIMKYIATRDVLRIKSTLLCFIYFPHKATLKCTAPISLLLLLFSSEKRKTHFPLLYQIFPLHFSFLAARAVPEWKLKVGNPNRLSKISKCIKKKEKAFYESMIHILSFIDNHKSSPKENLCICSVRRTMVRGRVSNTDLGLGSGIRLIFGQK